MSLDNQLLTRSRKRLLEMHYRAKVGHIGGNLSALDAIMLVHHEFMDEHDHFVLSKGHAAGALYIVQWSLGRLSDSDLETFHQDDSQLPGHPPPLGLPGVEFATGSLGHGLSLASGLALSKKLTKSPGRVFCLCSDGEWQEGSTWEALIFAAHQRLSALTVMIDANGLQGFGTTQDVASLADLGRKLSAFDIDLVEVDGHDIATMRDALAVPATQRPKVLVLKTIKGHGVSFMQNRMEWHYLPMSAQQFEQAMAEVEQS